MTLDKIIEKIKNYRGSVKIMEVCGTHTSSIFKHGIRSIIPQGIKLLSGPGCPVCVTPASDIDDLIEISYERTVYCFGDMFRVPGSGLSLSDAKAGGSVRLMYSPFEIINVAKENPDKKFTAAAVGFETTAPVYAALIDELIFENITNVTLYTALKTIPEALEYICGAESVDAFICPGHVAAVTGSAVFEKLCEKYEKPFVIAGFEAEHILSAVYEIINQIERGRCSAKNLYPSVVNINGQERARAAIDKYFIKTDSVWRGIGEIKNSGYKLRDEYAIFSANRIGGRETGDEIEIHSADNTRKDETGSGLNEIINNESSACKIYKTEFLNGCRCADVLLGRIAPPECGLFAKKCTPESPAGACMVSSEGACGIYYTEGVFE